MNTSSRIMGTIIATAASAALSVSPAPAAPEVTLSSTDPAAQARDFPDDDAEIAYFTDGNAYGSGFAQAVFGEETMSHLTARERNALRTGPYPEDQAQACRNKWRPEGDGVQDSMYRDRGCSMVPVSTDEYYATLLKAITLRAAGIRDAWAAVATRVIEAFTGVETEPPSGSLIHGS